MRKFQWIAFAGGAACAVALGACGGGTRSKDKTATAVGSSPAGVTSTAGVPTGSATKGTAAATASSSTTAAATASESGNGGNPDDVKAAARKFAASTFKGTYKLSGTGADLFSDGQLVLEKQGKDKFRFDVTAKQNGQDSAIIFIETPDASSFCLKDAGEFGALFGIENGQGVCFKSDPSDTSNPLGGISESLTALENSNVTVLDTSKKTVAGKDGTCYRTKDNDTSEITTTCFSNDGIVLYANTEGDNASTIEAQSISTDVKSDDFNLPYEVRDLPGSDPGTGSTSTPVGATP